MVLQDAGNIVFPKSPGDGCALFLSKSHATVVIVYAQLPVEIACVYESSQHPELGSRAAGQAE